MKTTVVAAMQCLLAFTAVGAPSMGAAQDTISVTCVTFEVDWYDDGRENPYTVSFNYRDADSIYSFDADGVLHQLAVGDGMYTFSYADDDAITVDDGDDSIVTGIGSRMLRDTRDEDLDQFEDYGGVEPEVVFSHRRLYDCDTCEHTWDTVCDSGIDNVCDLVPSTSSSGHRHFWTRDARRSIRTMCRKFSKRCRRSGHKACKGQCTDAEPETTPAPSESLTRAPVPTRTDAPGTASTHTPVARPTGVPVAAPTEAPAARPTGSPAAKTTDAPMASLTSAPSSAPTIAPNAVTTVAPVGMSTVSPATASTDAPALPTEAPAYPVSPPTGAPVFEQTNAPARPTTDSPQATPTSNPVVLPTDTPRNAPTDGPVATPTSAPVAVPTNAPLIAPTNAPVTGPTDGPAATPTGAPLRVPTDAPVTALTNAPVSSPDACNPNPCLNGGACALDPAGGYICTCATNYGGMACQTDTTSLSPFYIEFDFSPLYEAPAQARFQAAADRWSQVITHVPCGGDDEFPGGRLLISVIADSVDNLGAFVSSGKSTRHWTECNVGAVGEIKFDFLDWAYLSDAEKELYAFHEMGHVIGIGDLWDKCSTCATDGGGTWSCPATNQVYADLGGTDPNIVETTDGLDACFSLDEAIFGLEISTGVLAEGEALSKITAAVLEDIGYIVDPSAVDPYILLSAV